MAKVKILFVSVSPFDLESTSRYFEWLDDDRYEITNFFINGGPANKICEKYCKICDFSRPNRSQILENIDIIKANPSAKSLYHQNFKNLKRYVRDVHGKWLLKKINNELQPILQDFHPDFILLDFTYYSFLSLLACQLSKQYNSPLLVSINDDFVLKQTLRNGIFYRLLQRRAKRALQSIRQLNDSRFIYINNKMAKAYSDSLNLKEKEHLIIYPSSNIFKSSEKMGDEKSALYYGNIGLGRIDTLCKISTIFRKFFDISLHLYPSNLSKTDLKIATEAGVVIHKKVPHDELIEIFDKHNIIVLAESFKKKNIDRTFFSASTKLGEILSMNKKILCVAPLKSGIGSFFNENNLNYYCCSNDEESIKKTIENLLSDECPIIDKKLLELFSLKENKNRFFSFLSYNNRVGS